MKVLVIPEDQQLDQYVLKPVVERIFEDLARPARVEVLPEPRLRGSDQALDPILLAEIVAANRVATDLFLLIVDRDCDRAKHTTRIAECEQDYRDLLLGCLAVEEVETWMLALHRDAVESQLKTTWSKIRNHCDPKETFALPFLDQLGSSGPGRGRKAAMRALQGQWRSLCSLCPEIGELRERIAAWIASRVA